MAIKSVTPVMTSNTTPEPYKASRSSSTHLNYEAWKAFTGTNINEYDSWRSFGCERGWIALDFGSSVAVSGVELTSVNSDFIGTFEKFEVHGSMDEEEWEIISSFDEGISTTPNTKKTFSFGKMFFYRHYKIYIPDAKNECIIIGEINFICDSNLRDKKLNFYKTLSKDIPEFIENDGNQIHFTEKGEIFINDSSGKLMKCEDSDTETSADFADKSDIDSLLKETGFL